MPWYFCITGSHKSSIFTVEERSPVTPHYRPINLIQIPHCSQLTDFGGAIGMIDFGSATGKLIDIGHHYRSINLLRIPHYRPIN